MNTIKYRKKMCISMAQDDDLSVDVLASIYRTECGSKSLSGIRKDFYSAARSLSESARRDYEDALRKDPGSIASEGNNERRKRIQTLFRNIVDIRMEKISSLALRGAMGGDNQIDHLTGEEREFYSAMVEVSKKHRSVLDPQSPKVKPTSLNVEPGPKNQEPIIVKEPVIEKRCEPAAKDAGDTVTVRILEDLPVFSGPDRDYDLKKEDVIRMPAVMANALIVREKAVKINVTP